MGSPPAPTNSGLDWPQRLPRRADRMMTPRPLTDEPPPRRAVPRGHDLGGAKPPAHRAPDRIGELDPARPTAFFCNGAQWAATPSAVNILLTAGYPAEAILYYRGGLHDWITLGSCSHRCGHVLACFADASPGDD